MISRGNWATMSAFVEGPGASMPVPLKAQRVSFCDGPCEIGWSKGQHVSTRERPNGQHGRGCASLDTTIWIWGLLCQHGCCVLLKFRVAEFGIERWKDGLRDSRRSMLNVVASLMEVYWFGLALITKLVYLLNPCLRTLTICLPTFAPLVIVWQLACQLLRDS